MPCRDPWEFAFPGAFEKYRRSRVLGASSLHVKQAS